MKPTPVSFHQTIATKEFVTTLRLTDVVSYGCKRLAYTFDADERIHAISDNGVATLYCSSAGERERLSKQLKSERPIEIRVSAAVPALNVVRFERGWPEQSLRTVLWQDSRVEATNASFARAYLPPFQARGFIALLAPGSHPERLLYGISKSDVVRCGTNQTRVVVEQVQGMWPHVVIVTAAVELANRLANDINANLVHTIEINEAVHSIILANDRFVRVYGYAKLPLALRAAFEKHQVRHAKDPQGQGEHSADRFPLYPYHEVQHGLQGFAGEHLLRIAKEVKP